MNALDMTLVKLNGACNLLEKHRPALGEIKKARDLAKTGFKLLDAAVALLEEDVYEVSEKPDESTPLFAPSGDPAPGASVEPPAPVATPLQTLGYDPDKVIDVEVEPAQHPLDGLEEVSALDDAFTELLEQLLEAGVEDGLKRKVWKTYKAEWLKAWNLAWEEEDYPTAIRVVYDAAAAARDQHPVCWAVPQPDAKLEETA